MIYLPVIAYNGSMRAEFGMSYASLMLKAHKKNIDIFSNGIFFESLIPRARNTAAMNAMKNGSDYLLFIDTDIFFNPEDVFKLIDLDKDIVAGAYAKKYYNPEKVRVLAKNKPEFFENDSWKSLATDFSSETLDAEKVGDLLEVDYAATGFMLIKTGVLRLLAKNRARPYNNDISGYGELKQRFFDFFPASIHNDKYESEDYGFCRLVREEGLKIYIDPSIKLWHVGSESFGGDLISQGEIFEYKNKA